jgi:hypothetical protein
VRRKLIGPIVASAAMASMLIGSATVASATHVVEMGDTATLLTKGAGLLVPVEVVNGHQDLPVGGHQNSRPTDSRNPGGRTADLRVSVS